MPRCPSDEQLELLLDELLDEEVRQHVEMHIEDCPACIERLEQLVGRPSFAPAADGFDPLVGGSGQADNGAENTTNPLPRRREADRGRPIPRDASLDIPGYELLGEIGSGGMGLVYMALQHGLNRIVAIKMLGSLDRNINEAARFRLEAEAVAQLHHPNIVQIHEVGDYQGLPYFSMEYVEGGRLEDLAGTPQPADVAAEIVEILARAIHEAHRHGIVHRDLKPANILLQRSQAETGFGTPKISDFGLVKHLSSDSNLTQSGLILGTPSYMSPEQTKGSSVGPACDIWALGIILYELLTGRPPFLGDDPMNTLHLVNTAEPVPPRRLQPRVPRDLQTICLKCLEKSARRRYESALELAEDLRRFRNGETIHARPVTMRERGWKWAKRRPGLAASLAFSLVTLTTIAGSAAWYALETRAAEHREARRLADVQSESREKMLEGQRYLGQSDWNNAQLVLSSLCSRLEMEPGLAGLLAEARSMRDQAERGAEDRRRFSAFRQARAEAMFHDVHVSGLDAERNVKGTRRAARTALRVFMKPDAWELAPLPASLTRVEKEEVKDGSYEMLLVLARALSQPLPGEGPEARARAGLDVLKKATELRAPTSAYHRCRSSCLARLKEAEAARQARADADRQPPASVFGHFLLGQELCKRNELRAAAREFETVLQEEPDHFWARCLLAICHLRERKPESARIGLTACIGSEPALIWLYLLRGFATSELAALRQAQRQTPVLREEAAALFAAAEDDYQRVLELEPDDDLRYILLLNRGTMRFQRQQWDAAEADFLAAVELRPKQFNAYASLAQVHKRRNNLARANAQLTQAIQLEPELASLYRTRAYLHLDHPEQLSAAQRQAVLADLDKAIRLEAPNNPALAEDQVRRGLLLHLGQRWQEALQAYEAALKVTPGHAGAHRHRLATLLQLRRYDDVLHSSNIALKRGKPTANLYEMRGLARAGRQDFVGAIEDYTHALALKPAAEDLHRYRGWAYLVTRAHQLALHDFERALELDSSSGDAYSGRGFARACLGLQEEGAKDAFESLRLGGRTPRLLYNAARTLAQASVSVRLRTQQQGEADAVRLARQYQEVACSLLTEAMEKTPAGERAAYWKDVVSKDNVIKTLRRMPVFARLAGKYQDSGG